MTPPSKSEMECWAVFAATIIGIATGLALAAAMVTQIWLSILA